MFAAALNSYRLKCSSNPLIRTMAELSLDIRFSSAHSAEEKETVVLNILEQTVEESTVVMGYSGPYADLFIMGKLFNNKTIHDKHLTEFAEKFHQILTACIWSFINALVMNCLGDDEKEILKSLCVEYMNALHCNLPAEIAFYNGNRFQTKLKELIKSADPERHKSGIQAAFDVLSLVMGKEDYNNAFISSGSLDAFEIALIEREENEVAAAVTDEISTEAVTVLINSRLADSLLLSVATNDAIATPINAGNNYTIT